MKALEYNPEPKDFYRSGDFPNIDGNSAMEDAVGQSRAEVEGKPVEKDPASQEREQLLEAWMTDIKAFIRNIDTSKL